MQENLLNISHQLETERTVVKKYNEGDGLAFFELIQENKTRLVDSFPLTLANTSDETTTELYIQTKIAEWYEQKSFSFGIWTKEESQYIGHVSIKNIDWVIPKAELAYLITRDFEGKGLMSEVLTAIIKFCFEELMMNRLFLRVITKNDKSFRLAEKCGFKKEGNLRNDHRTYNGDLVDLFIYGLTSEDYETFYKNK
jgi:RimJ/RimL family protein N-acetyltransferase